jgi:SAM-dependent methyltransferase
LSEHHPNSKNFCYSRHEWLDSHHAVKSRMRSELIGKLPINSGDKVLDLGCGTGNWTILAAERVGLHGEVLGVDRDTESLERAERRRDTHPLKKIIRFERADIDKYQDSGGVYDKVFLFNILSYFRSANDFVRGICSSMPRSGLIFIKDTDLQSDFFWPVPYDLYSSLLSVVSAAPSKMISGIYNPFFAREVPGILNSINGIRTVTLSQSFSVFGPLVREEREYVRANARMLAAIADQNGGSEISAAWLALFEDGEDCVLDLETFMYSMTEFVFQVSFT